MANFIAFDEGTNTLASVGLPSTCYFLLSTKSVDATTPFAKADTLAAAAGEITGSGYVRGTQAEPSPAGGTVSFTQMSWATGTAVNWPAAVRSCVLATTSDNSGVMICAWNLYGGTARDMSAANTTENVTPQLVLAS